MAAILEDIRWISSKKILVTIYVLSLQNILLLSLSKQYHQILSPFCCTKTYTNYNCEKGKTKSIVMLELWALCTALCPLRFCLHVKVCTSAAVILL